MTHRPDRSLTFRAGGRLHFLASEAVREIVRLPRITPVPHSPALLAGIGNVRGAAVPVLSLSRAQGNLPDRVTVLVLDRSPAVGLLVDEVGKIETTTRDLKQLDIDALLADVGRQAPTTSAARRTDRIVTQPDATIASREVLLITFDVASQLFALPLEQVVEIIRLPPDVARMPHADHTVAGTIVHRGSVLPLLHLDMLLALVREADRSGTPNVVITTIRGRPVGLVVERIWNLLRLDEASIDPVPSVIAKRVSETKIRAIGRLPSGQGLVSILASEHLLDDRLTAQLGDCSIENETREEVAVMASDELEAFLLFRLSDQSFGLPARSVEAVVRIPEALVRVPRAPDFIEGVMSVQGGVVPVIDQRRRFGAAPAPIVGKRAILLSIGSLRACFVVDQIDEIRSINAASISAAPDLGVEPKLFDRMASLENGSRIVLLIEPGELLDGAERALLTTLASRVDLAPA